MDFIKEFQKLYFGQPCIYNWTRESVNCDYGHVVVVSKNSYMCFDCAKLEDCLHCFNTIQSVSSGDCTFCSDCELCYECLDSTRCYNSNFLQDCTGCTDCSYSYDCQGCFDCFGCVGLRYKRNYIFNEQYSPEEYAKKLEEVKQLPFAEIQERVQALRLKHPHRASHQINAERSSGDYIFNSKNCHHAFDIFNCEDCMYIDTATLELGSKDSVDVGPIANGVELCYDVTEAGMMYNCTHCHYVTRNRDIHWSSRLWDCEECFGCVYLKNKKHYFLNQPCSPEEYARNCAEAKKQLTEAKIYDFCGIIHAE